MRRSFSSNKSLIGVFAVLALACGAMVFAQQAAGKRRARRSRRRQRRGGGGGGAAAAAGSRRSSQVMKVEWVRPEGQTGQVPIVQGNVVRPQSGAEEIRQGCGATADVE